MSIVRISCFGLLASVALSFGTFSGQGTVIGQDFNERFAAWQGSAPPMQRARTANSRQVVPTSNQVIETSQPVPAQRSQKTMTDAYNAPYHTPNYNAPWTSSPCATCNHNATFEPVSDAIGTCGFVGGGCGCGQCGDSCGPSACGPGCFGCGQCGGHGGGCDFGPLCSNPMVWIRLEALLWWRQGQDAPALVTTDPTTESSTTAGILPDAQILFGNGRLAQNMQGGGRIDFGFFLNPTQTVGFGDRVYGVGKSNNGTSFASNNTPVLAIPFRDLDTGNNDALLVAYPGLRTGTINIDSTSTFFGNDVYARFLLCQDCNTRIDFVTGWNYTRIGDNFQIRSQQTVTEIGGNIPVGTVSTIVDQFNTRNQFNGAILGLQWQRNCGVWTWQTMGRMSLGSMHETLLVNGSTTIASPGQTTQTTTGGLFTAGSNIGRHSRNEFTAITEFGLNLGYRFSPCTQLNIGYTLIYINDVIQPAKNIDTSIGGSTNHPLVAFQHSDFLIQGLNLGVTREF